MISCFWLTDCDIRMQYGNGVEQSFGLQEYISPEFLPIGCGTLCSICHAIASKTRQSTDPVRSHCTIIGSTICVSFDGDPGQILEFAAQVDTFCFSFIDNS